MQIQLQKFFPQKDLLRYIRFYYTLNIGKDAETVHLDNHPQGCIDIMFMLRGGINFGVASEMKGSISEMFIIGQQTRNFNFMMQPDVQAVGVTFTAEGFAKIFRTSMKELTANGVDAIDLFGKEDHTLAEQIAEIKDNDTLITFLNQVFKRKIYENAIPFDAVDEAIQRIRLSRGQTLIQDLATEFNMSIRTLQRKFLQKTGVSPKSFSRVSRFNHMMRILRNSTQINWQDILWQCGYFDQMHFIKEFKLFTGLTPTRFVHKNPMLSEFFLSEEYR